LLTDQPIALVYYNKIQSAGVCFEERHAHDRNPEAHKQQHLSIGTFCNPYPSIAGYTLAPTVPTSADICYSLSTFTIYDEDISVVSSAINQTTDKQVFYQSAGPSWYFGDTNQYGFSYGTYIKYNQFTGLSYTLTELTTNEYVNYYIFGTTSISANARLLTIPSTNKFSSLALAQEETLGDVLNINSLPLQEWVLLYKITYKTGAAYSTDGKCRIESVEAYTGTRQSTTSVGTGISQAFADATYLRLDGTNDPITGEITFSEGIYSKNIMCQCQTITAATTWNNLANKDISNSGTFYDITLPLEPSVSGDAPVYRDIAYNVTTDSIGSGVGVRVTSGAGALIFLNGASGTTNISLSGNKFYTAINRGTRWYFES
jgi:hypothetical protein